jgi:hypothetical protein
MPYTARSRISKSSRCRRGRATVRREADGYTITTGAQIGADDGYERTIWRAGGVVVSGHGSMDGYNAAIDVAIATAGSSHFTSATSWKTT